MANANRAGQRIERIQIEKFSARFLCLEIYGTLPAVDFLYVSATDSTWLARTGVAGSLSLFKGGKICMGGAGLRAFTGYPTNMLVSVTPLLATMLFYKHARRVQKLHVKSCNNCNNKQFQARAATLLLLRVFPGVLETHLTTTTRTRQVIMMHY